MIPYDDCFYMFSICLCLTLSLCVGVFRCCLTLCPQPGVRPWCSTGFYWREWQRSSNKIPLWSSSASSVTTTWWRFTFGFCLSIHPNKCCCFQFSSTQSWIFVCLCVFVFVCRVARSLWVGPLPSLSLKQWRSTTRSPVFVSLTSTWGGLAPVSCWPPLSWLNWTTLALERWHLQSRSLHWLIHVFGSTWWIIHLLNISQVKT